MADENRDKDRDRDQDQDQEQGRKNQQDQQQGFQPSEDMRLIALPVGTHLVRVANQPPEEHKPYVNPAVAMAVSMTTGWGFVITATGYRYPLGFDKNGPTPTVNGLLTLPLDVRTGEMERRIAEIADELWDQWRINQEALEWRIAQNQVIHQPLAEAQTQQLLAEEPARQRTA